MADCSRTKYKFIVIDSPPRSWRRPGTNPKDNHRSLEGWEPAILMCLGICGSMRAKSIRSETKAKKEPGCFFLSTPLSSV